MRGLAEAVCDKDKYALNNIITFTAMILHLQPPKSAII